MQYSILAGSLTLSIMLLPTIISTTEEALKEIPNTYRESSFGLGATKLQTISKIILPGALPGILVAVILSIGRIVGESAALIWTAGTVAQIPTALVGSEAGAATLTTKLYWLIKETADLETASSIAVVLLVLIISLNLVSKLITRQFLRKRGNQ
jgi:phosphate transport system permease protein